jgi:bifunctional enzyme CysN/CysC
MYEQGSSAGNGAATPPAGATIWITGLPAAGKSTLARAVVARALESGTAAYALDGDVLRAGLNSDLGFSHDDRAENIRRVGHVARVLADAGVLAVAAVISPFAYGRALARAAHERAGIPFLEVWVDTPLAVCEQRDPKGLYAAARRGEIERLTGVSDPYEPPADPDVRVAPGPVDEAAERVLTALHRVWNPAAGAGFTQSLT